MVPQRYVDATIYAGVIDKMNLNHGDMCTQWDWGVGETSHGIQMHLLHGEKWKITLND